MATDTLVPLGEVTRRLRILGQSYVGMHTIPINRIVGSVDRAVAGNIYLWVHYKLRELRTIDRTADWPDAAAARAAEPVSRSHREAARRERRTPLPRRA